MHITRGQRTHQKLLHCDSFSQRGESPRRPTSWSQTTRSTKLSYTPSLPADAYHARPEDASETFTLRFFLTKGRVAAATDLVVPNHALYQAKLDPVTSRDELPCSVRSRTRKFFTPKRKIMTNFECPMTNDLPDDFGFRHYFVLRHSCFCHFSAGS